MKEIKIRSIEPDVPVKLKSAAASQGKRLNQLVIDPLLLKTGVNFLQRINISKIFPAW